MKLYCIIICVGSKITINCINVLRQNTFTQDTTLKCTHSRTLSFCHTQSRLKAYKKALDAIIPQLTRAITFTTADKKGFLQEATKKNQFTKWLRLCWFSCWLQLQLFSQPMPRITTATVHTESAMVDILLIRASIVSDTP